MKYDICIKTTSQSALIAALAPLGLTVVDNDGKEHLKTASHEHAMAYVGKIVATPAVIDPVTMAVITEATYHPGEYAIMRAGVDLLAQVASVVEVVEPPAGCMTFGEWRTTPGVDMQEVKDAACARLNAKRDAIQYGTFTDSNGHPYDVDSKGREKMAGLEAKIANGLTLPEGFSWTGADNEERPHTTASFLLLTTEILLWTSQVHGVCVAGKAAVRAAETVEAVKAAEEAVVWP